MSVKKLTSQLSSSSFELEDSSSSLSPPTSFRDSPPKKHQAMTNTAAPDRPRKGKSRNCGGSDDAPLSLSRHCRKDRNNPAGSDDDDDEPSSPGINPAVPRSEDFSRTLCKLVADDAGSRQQLRQRRDNSLGALKQLWNWARSVRGVDEIEAIVADFVDYGGVLKILDFLRREDCAADPKCVAGATWVLVEFLSLADGISGNTARRRHRRSSSYTRSYVEMSKTIVRRDGVHALSAAMTSLKFEEDSSLAIANIWRALGRIVNKKSLKLMDASEQLSIIDAANYCLRNIERLQRKLGQDSDDDDDIDIENDNNMGNCSCGSGSKKEQNNEWLDDILRPLLYTVGNAMNETSALTRVDFRRTKIVNMCLRAVLQRQGQLGDSKDGVIGINEVVLENLLFILRFSSMNDILNSPGDCAELVLPLCIYCITNDSNGDSGRGNKGSSKKSIELDGLELLEETCSKVDEAALENSGALEAVTSLIMNSSRANTDTNASGDVGDNAGDAVIADGGNDDETAIKRKAHAVMRKMLKRTRQNSTDSVLD